MSIDSHFKNSQDNINIRDLINPPPSISPTASSPELTSTLQPSDSLRERPPAAAQAGQLTVFLCHSSGDKPTIRSLFRRLQKDEFQPWLDEEDLLPGQDWKREIENAVRTSAVVIVCLSHSSVTKEGFVQKELKYALDVAEEKPDGTIFIIPLRLEDCSVPERLRKWHWVNLFEHDGYEKLLRALRTRLKESPGSKLSNDTFETKRLTAPSPSPVAANGTQQEPRYLYTVKLKYHDEPEHIEGTRAEEPYGSGVLFIYDGDLVVARHSEVESWSRQHQRQTQPRDTPIPDPVATKIRQLNKDWELNQKLAPHWDRRAQNILAALHVIASNVYSEAEDHGNEMATSLAGTALDTIFDLENTQFTHSTDLVAYWHAGNEVFVLLQKAREAGFR